MADDRLVTVLDAGVLIALLTGEPVARQVSHRIESGEDLFLCSEMALSELTYIVCRRSDWKTARAKTGALLDSGAVRVVPTEMLWSEAARIKCMSSIALPDCFTVAAAVAFNGRALFARREKEIVASLKQNLLPDVLSFLA
jgi:predicted nucleic acid-binding protein